MKKKGWQLDIYYVIYFFTFNRFYVKIDLLKPNFFWFNNYYLVSFQLNDDAITKRT